MSGGGVGGVEVGWLVGAVVAGLIIMTIVGIIQLWYGHRVVGGMLLLPAAIVVCSLAWAGLRSALQSMGKN